MDLEEQRALLRMWSEFLDGRRPSGRLMREFYFDCVSYTGHYRYGMAPDLFDLLVNGVFRLEDARLWHRAYHPPEAVDTSGDPRAA